MKAQCQFTGRRSSGVIDVLGGVGSAVVAWYLVVIALSMFFAAGCDSSADEKEKEMSKQDESVQSATSRTFYEGYEDDLKAMRETRVTVVSSDETYVVSTGMAIEAAQRFFEKVDFIGMTREDVLELLGDPGSISDYGVPAKPGPNEPLVYSFSNGWYGAVRALQFEAGKVIAVEIVPTE